MIYAFVALLACQLAGEALGRSLGLPVPGPVLGMLLLLGILIAIPRAVAPVRPVAQGILGHLSLLFVPAGVGVVGHLAELGPQIWVVLLAVILSTVLSIAAGALTFAAVARATNARDD
jgi:putative effector of murein hydrolase LrgA (UPF0299 family)